MNKKLSTFPFTRCLLAHFPRVLSGRLTDTSGTLHVNYTSSAYLACLLTVCLTQDGAHARAGAHFSTDKKT